MKQKGFATILGLCLILVVALIVKGIQDAETNHAREISNFELEQALQSAAESGIAEAAEYIRKNPSYLPFSDAWSSKKKISVANKIFNHGEQKFNITVEVRGERGKIYFYDTENRKITTFRYKDADGNIVKEKNNEVKENYLHGVYLMSRATMQNSFFGEKIYRRVYAYILMKNQEEYRNQDPAKYQIYEKVYSEEFEELLNDPNCETKFYFMESP